jgi:hypothetical protein
MREVTEISLRLGLDPVLVGSGLATDQSPAAGSHVRGGARVTAQFANVSPKPAKPAAKSARAGGLRKDYKH